MKCVGWCELVFTKTTVSTWVNSSLNAYTYVRMYVHIVKIATVQIKFSFSIAQLLITQYINLLCNIYCTLHNDYTIPNFATQLPIHMHTTLARIQNAYIRSTRFEHTVVLDTNTEYQYRLGLTC